MHEEICAKLSDNTEGFIKNRTKFQAYLYLVACEALKFTDSKDYQNFVDRAYILLSHDLSDNDLFTWICNLFSFIEQKTDELIKNYSNWKALEAKLSSYSKYSYEDVVKFGVELVKSLNIDPKLGVKD